MIKRLTYIVLILAIAVSASAQVVSPLGYGLANSPEKVGAYNNGIVAICADDDSNIVVNHWNGHFWHNFDAPPLPKLGLNPDGEFTIVDIEEINGELFLAAKYTVKNTPTAKNYVVKWNGNSWEDVSTTIISESQNITDLVNLNGKLQCIGVFHNQSGNVLNIAELNGSEWTGVGNNIVRANTADKFKSISVRNGQLYSTGNFTSPNGQHTLAIWNGSQWDVAPYPAFVGNNKISGTYLDQVVIYGESPFETDKIKISNGSVWNNMSDGMENIQINNIAEFGQVDSALFALGEFTDNLTGNNFELMVYQDNKWSRAALGLDHISHLFSSNQRLIVGGTFSDDARLKNIGEVDVKQGQIVSRVFYDDNGDCIKQDEEDWAPNYPLTFDTALPFVPTDKHGAFYLPVSKGDYRVNAKSTTTYSATCPDKLINVDGSALYQNNYFGVKKIDGTQDLKVVISDNQSFSGLKHQNKQVLVCAENVGTENITNAELMLHLGNSISQFASQKSYASFEDNIAKYNVDLDAGEKECFYITFEIEAEDEMVVTSVIALDVSATDTDPSNNSSVLQYKKGETEDNFKDCGNGEYLKENEELLSYKIGFKNIGTSQVYDMKVVDVLDPGIHISTKGIEVNTPFENCSVLATAETGPNGEYELKLVMSISDINLQPSASTDIQSKGYLDLNLNVIPKYQVLGLQLCNTADIFFSYKKGTFDEPMRTNTVCSQVSELASLPDFGGPNDKIFNGIKIGPIPTDRTLFVENGTTEDLLLELTNVLGQRMLSSKIDRLEKLNWDVSELTPGTYILYVDGVFSKKVFIK